MATELHAALVTSLSETESLLRSALHLVRGPQVPVGFPEDLSGRLGLLLQEDLGLVQWSLNVIRVGAVIGRRDSSAGVLLRLLRLLILITATIEVSHGDMADIE